MNNVDKALLIILALIYIGLTWGIPKTDIYNAIVTLLVAFVTAGIIFRKRRRREA